MFDAQLLDREIEAGLERHSLTKESIRPFILAGNAIFTIQNEKTGGRFTFKVATKKNDPTAPHWVRVLTGPDNTDHYTFMGTIFGMENYVHSRKSNLTLHAQSVKVFLWFWNALSRNELPDCIKVYHEGRCGRCGRRLTVPESIENGLGPVCLGLMEG